MKSLDIETRNLLADLILSEHETRGNPCLPLGSGPSLRPIFTRVLVNRKDVLDHIRFLQKAFGRRFRHTELLPEDLQKAILARGLPALDDDSLAQLLLNPVALLSLHEAIDERMPSTWLGAMEENGRALLEENGLGVPDLPLDD